MKECAKMASNTSASGRYKNFHAKLLGVAHRSLFERQTLNYHFTKLAGGAYLILSLRDNHRNPNIHIQLAGGAKKRPLSSRGKHQILKCGTRAGAVPRISVRVPI
ncbi:hypothetical protein TNCV_2225201 [Trichonephila clavipes]|nr:hypothetical protein TNCV_2225201 [Trichonephila clavipes]